MVHQTKFYAHYLNVPKEIWRWKNFTPQEIACKGSDSLLIDFKSMDMLQRLREEIGAPLIINSAYRSEAHNRNIGGSPNSYHKKGMAFDISLSNHNRYLLLIHAAAIGFKGFGLYDDFIHIDTREKITLW